jgi:Holliday junction resolvase RusA-like endonuclease
LTPPGLIVVEVRGLPKPAGSKRVFLVGKGAARRPVVTDDCRTGRDWRASVQHAIDRVHPGPPLEGPLEVCFYFTMPRPQFHFRRGGAVRPSAPEHPTTKPDVTKLVRAVEDAATGLLWRDDSQLVTQTATKRYGSRPGVLIHCRVLETGGKHQCDGKNSTTTRSSSPRASRDSSTCA